MAEVVLRNVSKTYPGPVRAVDHLSLTVADGELLVVVGPSGAGKTALLRMIAGLETPTSGTISIGGRVVDDIAPPNRDVAMVFQHHGLYPHMTVRQNLAFPLKARRMGHKEIDRRVLAAAEMLGVAELMSRRPLRSRTGRRS